MPPRRAGAPRPPRERRRRSGAEDGLVYGRNVVREILASGTWEVREVFALDDLAGEEWLSAAGSRPRTRGELAALAGSGDHQGVVARVGPFPYADARDLVPAEGPLVCLDGAHDPRNIGAIARVAEGAGAAGLVLPSRGGPGVTPALAKASAGAVAHLPVARVGSVAAFVHDARGAGRRAVGAHPAGGSDFRAGALDPGVLLVMGAEGEGLRRRVRDSCDLLVSIPMRGRVQSLNISVACGLLLYEAIRNVKS
jgi:23S rRNA (guanosine2251-2'-O)-methyltransferase